MSRFRRRLMGLAALRQAKEDDFIRCEYIENTSNAYIDTKIFPNNNTNVEIRGTISTTKQYIFGARTAAFNRAFGFYGIDTTNKARWDYGNRLVNGDFALDVNVIYQISNNKNVITVYNESTETSNSITATNNTFTCQYTMYYFGVNQQNVLAATTKGKLYYFKIYDGSTLVRDFIPMYQISTDTYGLWDRVKEEFYTSPNGVKFTGGERLDTIDMMEIHPKLIANTYINQNTGVQQKYNGWSSCDYIDVEGFNYIQVPYPFPQTNYLYGAYYDKDKKRISNTASFTIPSNAKYVRLSTTTASFTNVWLFKRQFTTSNTYQTNHYIETDGSIRAYNGWNIFNTESVYNYFYCWIYAQSYRYQASYNADGSVYQSGKEFLEKPNDGKVLLSDSHTSITYYAGYNYEYKNMNE